MATRKWKPVSVELRSFRRGGIYSSNKGYADVKSFHSLVPLILIVFPSFVYFLKKPLEKDFRSALTAFPERP
jgi:hypothetical protein